MNWRQFGDPAAFRRLCVETIGGSVTARDELPAAFRRLCVETKPCLTGYRRLCVETALRSARQAPMQPAAFRRLCVETIGGSVTARDELPAAFRRLCVETKPCLTGYRRLSTSRLQAAVC